MNSETVLDILLLVLLLLFSAFFSSAETSLTTANRIRIRTLADQGNGRARTLLKILEEPEMMRRVGEGAQREIYVSWEEAVSRAYERYFAVIDNFRRGMYPERDKFSDEFFRGVANVMDIGVRSRKLQQQMVQQIEDQMNADAMSSYDSFMGRMDRFL